MSYHTWAYKKVSALTDAEKNEVYETELSKASSWWGFKKTFPEIVAFVENWFERHPQVFCEDGMTPVQYAKNMVNEFTDKLHAIQNGGFEAVYKNHKKAHGGTSLPFFNYNGEDYMLIGFDKPFRLCRYVLEKFDNEGELLAFLETQNPKEVGYYNNGDFITEDMCGVAERINDFFKEHGEGNIVIAFG